MNIRKNTWHFAGQRMRVHKIIGRKKDDIGWITLCGQHINGISTNEVHPSNYPKHTCKNCLRLSCK